MPTFDLHEISQRMVAAVRAAIARSEKALGERLDELEARLKAVPAGERGERGEQGPAGKDADVEQLEQLIEIKVDETVGAIPKAPNGADGRDGRDGLPGLPGKDGAPGMNGADGFGLEDFDMVLGADGRTLSFTFKRGEVVIERSVRLATMLYREVWREGAYERGDVVTWSGAAWHCQRATDDKPQGSDAWKLMVKAGRPGKDAVPAAPAEPKVVRLK